MRDREVDNGYVDLTQELGENNLMIGFSQPVESFEIQGVTECGTPILKLSPPDEADGTVAKQTPPLPFNPPSQTDRMQLQLPENPPPLHQIVAFNEKKAAEVEDLYDAEHLDAPKHSEKKGEGTTVYYNNCTFNITKHMG